MTARRTFVLFLIGVFLVQTAWIAAMPAFRGPDEFDHVFRADGVANGALMPGDNIPSARGSLTPVRTSVIDAGSAVCASYKYTGFHDCHAYGEVRDGVGQIGSGAGRYNPAYYVVVGNVARFFDGVAVDYVIRFLTAAMCALLLAWAAALWVGRRRSHWSTLAFGIALTPVLLFSTSIAAPNGVSYAAAVLLWVGGLAFVSSPRDEAPPGSLAAVVVGAVVMCNTHTTGPLWLLLIAITWCILKPAAVWQAVIDRKNRIALVVVALGGAASAVWTIASGANLPDPSGKITSSPEIAELFTNEIAWLFQTIAAFPLRNEMAPVPVYVLWLVGFVMLLVHGFRQRGRTAVLLTWMIVATIATQTALTYVGFKTDGYAWQGRYGLPFTVGLALLPALMDGGRKQPIRPLYHFALASMVLAAGLSVWHVGHNERLFFQRPWTDYVGGGPVLAGLLAALGTAVMIRALAGNQEPAPDRIGTEEIEHREGLLR